MEKIYEVRPYGERVSRMNRAEFFTCDLNEQIQRDRERVLLYFFGFVFKRATREYGGVNTRVNWPIGKYRFGAQRDSKQKPVVENLRATSCSLENIPRDESHVIITAVYVIPLCARDSCAYFRETKVPVYLRRNFISQVRARCVLRGRGFIREQPREKVSGVRFRFSARFRLTIEARSGRPSISSSCENFNRRDSPSSDKFHVIITLSSLFCMFAR